MNGGAEPSDDTGKRISGWLKSKAATLEEHVKEMRENTKLIAQDMAGTVQKGIVKPQQHVAKERLDVTFTTRALGLELDLQAGAVVRLIKPGGQAESLQVCVHDKLVAIAGEPLPSAEECPEFVELIKQRMSAMPRPVTLSFVRQIVGSPAASSTELPVSAAGPEDSEPLIGMVKQRMPKLSRPVGLAFARTDDSTAELHAELAALRELLQRHESEAAAARADAAAAKQDAKAANNDAVAAVEEAHALRADLADLQLSKVWNAQEVQRSHAEAESALSEAAEARAAMLRLSADVERMAGERLATEQALAAVRQEVVEQRAQAEQLSAHEAEAAATVAELRGAVRLLEGQLEHLQSQLGRAHAAYEEQVLERRKAEQLHVASVKEVESLKQSEAASREQMSEMTRELESSRMDLRYHEATSATADKTIAELKREVERLYAEVQRSEAYETVADKKRGEPYKVLSNDDAREEISALTAEVEYLRSTMQQHEASAAASTIEVSELTGEVERLRALGATALKPPHPEPMVVGKAAPSSPGNGISCGSDAQESQLEEGVASQGSFDIGGGDMLSQLENSNAAACGDTDSLLDLQARVQELQERNGALERQLNARPIVYQFGPSLDELDDACGEEEDAYTHTNERTMGLRMFVYVAAIWCRRRVSRAASQCRRQRLTQSLERTLRSFTRTLLKRPVLLWLFYTHVIALWVIEFWRQAVNRPLEVTDPSSHLEQMVATAAKGKG